jgi:hypothetical protein
VPPIRPLNWISARSTGIALGLSALFLVAVWASAVRQCETVDEGLFIAGGAVQAQLGTPNVDLTHPPLPRWIAGIPATVIGGAKLPSGPPLVPRQAVDLTRYRARETFNWAVRFFYEPPHDHRRVLFWGRFGFALLGTLAGLLLFRELRRHFGPLPAVGAILLFFATPEVMAHSGFATSDVGAAFGLVIVCVTLAHALKRPGWRSDVALGTALGLAVLMKISLLLLLPIGALLVFFFPGNPPDRSPYTWPLLRIGRIVGVTWAVLILGYLPDPRLLPPHAFLATDLDRWGLGGAILPYLPLPDSLLKGIVFERLFASAGQQAFLHGEARGGGWLHYFPLALSIKYPMGLLLLAAAGIWRIAHHGGPPLTWKLSFLLPPLVVLVAAMSQKVNLGVRFVLPLAPALALLAGVAIAWQRWTWLLVATVVVEGALAWPYPIGYASPLFGGRANLHRWLADSNHDWGQDLPALKEATERRGIKGLHLAYWGAAVPPRWGIEAVSAETREPGWYAVSRNLLIGHWDPKDRYGWLRQQEPVEIVGSSIHLYAVAPDPGR